MSGLREDGDGENMGIAGLEGDQQDDGYYEEVLLDGTGDQPMFDGSRIDAHTFCSEFASIATTFTISERASNDLLHLVKRMAPPGNLCPDDINDVRLHFCDNDSNVLGPRMVTAIHRSPLSSSLFPSNDADFGSNDETKRRKPNEMLKKRRGRPPGSTKAAKCLAMAEAYEQRKQRLQFEANMTHLQYRTIPEKMMKFEREEEESDQQQQREEHFDEEWGQIERDGEQEFVVVVDDYGGLQQIPAHQQNSRQRAQTVNGAGGVMAKVLGSLDKLSKDVSSLRCQYSNRAKQKKDELEEEDGSAKAAISRKSGAQSVKREKPPKIRQTRLDFMQRRPKYFVKIFDGNGQIVPICDMSREDMVETVRISRADPETRILYHDQDITDRVLQKLDISLLLHNPSYCGRAVADALFSPEFLSRFHILAEGQTMSRSHRELLSPELNKVFYDTLRKLGASRIIPDDQFGWMEQSRDAVNQRNRDIKIPGCRRKFFQNSNPIFE